MLRKKNDFFRGLECLFKIKFLTENPTAHWPSVQGVKFKIFRSIFSCCDVINLNIQGLKLKFLIFTSCTLYIDIRISHDSKFSMAIR